MYAGYSHAVRLVTHTRQPRPVVLDVVLRTPVNSRIMQNYAAGHGARPLLITAFPQHATDIAGWQQRRALLEVGGAETVVANTYDSGRLRWSSILEKLQAAGLHSVMVEGGGSVIDELLCTHAQSPLLDVVIVTVAPTNVGEQGYGYKQDLWNTPNLRHIDSLTLSPDTVEVLAP